VGSSFFGCFLYLSHPFSRDPWPTKYWRKKSSNLLNVLGNVTSFHKVTPFLSHLWSLPISMYVIYANQGVFGSWLPNKISPFISFVDWLR
jgi:hypothetical protein